MTSKKQNDFESKKGKIMNKRLREVAENRWELVSNPQYKIRLNDGKYTLALGAFEVVSYINLEELLDNVDGLINFVSSLTEEKEKTPKLHKNQGVLFGEQD